MALIGTLTTAVSALRSFMRGLEVIGNNIANVSTTSFKSSQTLYSDNFSNLLQNAAPSPSNGNGSNRPAMQIGTGVQISSITSSFQQGSLSSTGLNTNLGIAGNGFFQVRDAASNQSYVTRAGDFRLDDQGYLTTAEGMRVQGLSDGSATYDATSVGGALTYTMTSTAPAAVGDIKIDFNNGIGNGLTNSTGGAFTDAQVDAGKPALQSFTIDPLGNVVCSLSNGDSFVRGRVLLQNFQDPNALVREGRNLFSGAAAAGPIGGNALSEANNGPGSAGLGKIQSGTLELSNVDLTKEFADMITTQRSFQAGSKLINVSDEVLQDIINLKR